MAKYTINDTTLTAIADAIREKAGVSGGIDPADMAGLIAAIESGGDDTYRIVKGEFTLASGQTSYQLFTPDELKEITGRRVQYFLMIDGFSNGTGTGTVFGYAAATGVADVISSTVCVINSPPYSMYRNNSGTLMGTINTAPFTASAANGITVKTSSSYKFGTQKHIWIMVMRDY